jgi:predicted nuclease with TOPRIM domain
VIDTPNLADPAVLTAIGVGSSAVGAGGMKLLEWWSHRGREKVKEKLAETEQKLTAEEKLREDLLDEKRELRAEIQQLRMELAAARVELREFGAMHLKTVADWQLKYGELLSEVAHLRATVATLQVQSLLKT